MRERELAHALAHRAPGRYQLEAAIAALHVGCDGPEAIAVTGNTVQRAELCRRLEEL